MQVTINAWQALPQEDDEEACFMAYKISGTIDGKPYCGAFHIEIDGRDVDYEHISGIELVPEEVGEVLAASLNHPELAADMGEKTAAFYG